MSYLALCAAPYDDTESMAPISPEKKKGKTKTIKKGKHPVKENVSNMISEIHKNQPAGSESAMGNFAPPPFAKSDTTEEEEVNDSAPKPAGFEDKPVNIEEFTTLESSQADNYFKNHIPYYTQMSEQPVSNDNNLLTKLDKILFLLEEQKDEKSGHVTEELILYSFLGIFLIFVTDSFARAGKYMR
tara:strand:- start:390 stop:947 length:558 start_codon:yes stop_codon:yes gene_type:complete